MNERNSKYPAQGIYSLFVGLYIFSSTIAITLFLKGSLFFNSGPIISLLIIVIFSLISLVLILSRFITLIILWSRKSKGTPLDRKLSKVGYILIFCSIFTPTVTDKIKYTYVDGVRFNKTKTKLIKYIQNTNHRGHYDIPDNVKIIEKKAFWKCRSLNSISIPASVTSIRSRAFDNPGIRHVTYLRSISKINFLGNPPELEPKQKPSYNSYFFPSGVTIYRMPDAKGWGETYGGRPVKIINKRPHY